MAYDSKAVKIKKETKAIATLMFDSEKRREFIKQMVVIEQRSASQRTSRNRGNKDGE